MIQLTLVTVGTLKEAYLKDAVTEYKKRLSQFARVDEINIKEEPIRNEDDSSEISRALDAEAVKIIQAMPKDAYKIALCVEGVSFSSEELAKKIGKAADECGKIALVIGSSHGLSETVKRECALRLSVSKLTFPHQLMRVILYEALYRSFTILAGKRYHK
jgi:23S rRNA (pseudouridine1915-N3)-methyltransferase